MDREQAERTIDQINRVLQSKPWLDFEVMEYRGNTLVVMGSIDTSAPHDIEVRFEGVSFLSLPMEWRTDTGAPPLRLVSGNEAMGLNRRFRAEQGSHVFRFMPEDYLDDADCLVCARTISLTKPAP